jgi:signal transduction histidine kinase/DNA-binding response OmpR family regulator
MARRDAANILIVDDRPDKLLAMEAILGDLGQNLVTARSGREALRRLLDQDFAVILLDINMPELDGFETAHLIRQHKKSAHTPIIFVTAFSDDMMAARGYSLGAVDYILTPVVPEILRTKVSVFVELFRKTAEVHRHAEERINLAREQAARTAAEEATRRSTFLAEASTVLASSLNLEVTLRGLTRVVIPFLADLSIIVVGDDPQDTNSIDLAWNDPVNGLATRSLGDPAEMPIPVWEVMQSVLLRGRSETLAELSIGAPVNTAQAPADQSNGQGFPVFAIKSLMVLPLLGRGRVLGALALAAGPSRPVYATPDLILAQDLTHRAAIALENARLYRNIQEADRQKTEFLAMLSHELRNPLAPIRNALQIFHMSSLTDPALIEARAVMDRQVQQLAGIVDDLLDVFRITRCKIVLHVEPIDLAELVQTTADDHRSALEENGLSLTLQVPSNPIWVQADRIRLAQVLSNLLQNAAKFTNDGDRVSIHVARNPKAQRATVTVRDTGIGIAPEMLPHVFETFTQADRSLDRNSGGLGLGLALVKGLVELHGGNVRASSAGLGRGAEIGFWLPLIEEPRETPSTGAPEVSDIKTRRILIVEDNDDTARTLQTLLIRYGHEVSVAPTGCAGVKSAQNWRPDVVLCDLGLPEMDGYEVARALRREPATAALRLIAISGYGQDEDRKRSQDAGFDVHLTKPVDLGELQRQLATK